jgi:hypothetical protein
MPLNSKNCIHPYATEKEEEIHQTHHQRYYNPHSRGK